MDINYWSHSFLLTLITLSLLLPCVETVTRLSSAPDNTAINDTSVLAMWFMSKCSRNYKTRLNLDRELRKKLDAIERWVLLSWTSLNVRISIKCCINQVLLSAVAKSWLVTDLCPGDERWSAVGASHRAFVCLCCQPWPRRERDKNSVTCHNGHTEPHMSLWSHVTAAWQPTCNGLNSLLLYSLKIVKPNPRFPNPNKGNWGWLILSKHSHGLDLTIGLINSYFHYVSICFNINFFIYNLLKITPDAGEYFITNVKLTREGAPALEF